MSLDVNLLREVITVVSFLVFVGIVAYAAHPRNRQRFARAAALPPDEHGQ